MSDTCSLCDQPLVGTPDATQGSTSAIEIGAITVCLYCIVRDRRRFPGDRPQALELLEVQLQHDARCGYENLLSHALSSAAMDRHDLRRQCDLAARRPAGFHCEWQQDGQVVEVDDQERFLLTTSFYDHPFVSLWAEGREMVGKDDPGCVVPRGDGSTYGYTEWLISEEAKLSDIWVGSIPALIIALARAGNNFPHHLPHFSSEHRDEAGNPIDLNDPGRWARSAPRLEQADLDHIRAFLILVGVIPEDSAFQLGTRDDEPTPEVDDH